jgi:two-component system, NtrC family, sensor histidine kinase PilS
MAKNLEANFNFTKSRSQMLIIEAVRLAFLVAILAITLVFQSFQPGFINFEVLGPIYILLATGFVLNALFLLFIDQCLRVWVTTAFLFFFDSFFITGLIYATGLSQSIFLFLYLVNIILCGFVFQRKGALVLSLWTSILFSFLLVFGPDIKGQTLFFAVGLNNIAFFSVAFLSGILSEQLNFMGSELKERGRDLIALKNLNRLIIENMATGLMTVDNNGIVLQSNQSAREILDLGNRSLVGHPINDLIPGLLQQLKTIDFGRLRSTKFDWMYKTPEQQKQVLETIVSPLKSEEGLLTGYVLTFQDLTKVRRLEFAVRQSEKLAAVGQLAAGIAHEIRNPLASISGSIQLLQTTFTSAQAAEERKLMSIVLKEIDRLNNLITEFLDYVRPDQQKDDPVDVNSLVKEIADLVKLNKALRADVVQKLSLNSTSKISGHYDKLKQALLNIVINAYQAMNDAQSPVIELSTEVKEQNVLIHIKDHGVGIDEKGLRKIFEPFHTTKPKGTGLGLAVVHKIIESHNGKIFVESTKGVGTEFTLEFPIRADGKSGPAGGQLGLADSPRTMDDLSWKKRGNG